MASIINDEKHWLDRAAEMKALAEACSDPGLRAKMVSLVDAYTRMADNAMHRQLDELSRKTRSG
jgi:hypothetical protein